MNKKTRIDVKIFKPGNILDYITPMIAQANENGGGLTPQDFSGYFNCMKHAADYRRKWSYTITENGDGMVVTEDGGETAVFSLAWIELNELQPESGETERAVKWWNELDEDAKAELLKQNATYAIALPTMPGEIVAIYRNAPEHLKTGGEASPAYGLHDAGSLPKGWDKQ